MDAPTILVAEDDALIADELVETLTDVGFNVIAAYSGTELLAKLESGADAINGLITDIRLGNGPDGWECARRARELIPNLAVLYVTGDSAVDWNSQGVPKSLVLQKPYAPAQIVTAISQLINSVPPEVHVQ